MRLAINVLVYSEPWRPQYYTGSNAARYQFQTIQGFCIAQAPSLITIPTTFTV